MIYNDKMLNQIKEMAEPQMNKYFDNYYTGAKITITGAGKIW